MYAVALTMGKRLRVKHWCCLRVCGNATSHGLFISYCLCMYVCTNVRDIIITLLSIKI